jgi:hypothetical protein
MNTKTQKVDRRRSRGRRLTWDAWKRGLVVNNGRRRLAPRRILIRSQQR